MILPCVCLNSFPGLYGETNQKEQMNKKKKKENIEKEDCSHCVIKHHCFDDCRVVGFLRKDVQ